MKSEKMTVLCILQTKTLKLEEVKGLPQSHTDSWNKPELESRSSISDGPLFPFEETEEVILI